jgi:23S rRNA (guanosine2251-2'-O)-methyltransferase
MVFYFCTMKKETLLFGIYPVIEALKAKQTIDKAYVQKGLQSPKIDAIVADLEALNTTISYVPLEKMEKLCRSNHQGIILISSPIEFVALETMVEAVLESKKTPLFLILDQISDVRNFGAILRTAECTGVDGVIIQKKGGAPVSGDTVKTSAGAIFNIPICKVDHIKDAIYYLQGSGITTIAATEKTQDTIYNLELNEPMAIVMGSEGLGVSKSVLSIVDKKASLPLLGVINSLNVSVACGALLYEVVRQRSK